MGGELGFGVDKQGHVARARPCTEVVEGLGFCGEPEMVCESVEEAGSPGRPMDAGTLSLASVQDDFERLASSVGSCCPKLGSSLESVGAGSGLHYTGGDLGDLAGVAPVCRVCIVCVSCVGS